jgi:hypothetical protein
LTAEIIYHKRQLDRATIAMRLILELEDIGSTIHATIFVGRFKLIRMEENEKHCDLGDVLLVSWYICGVDVQVFYTGLSMIARNIECKDAYWMHTSNATF